MEVFMDFTCPFCFIGLKRMMAALEESKMEDFRLVSFRLSPDLKENVNYVESLSKKYGVPMERALLMAKGPQDTLALEGINTDFSKLDEINTKNPHLVLKNYEGKDFYLELAYELFKTYFVDGKDISDVKVLQDVLNRFDVTEDVSEIINDENLLQKLEDDRKYAVEKEVNLVPTMILKSGEKVEGSQNTDNYIQIMNREALS